MRILWASNAPWNPSGYGTQTEQVVKRLVADGHEVAIAANYGLNGQPINYNGVMVYPNGFDGYGNDVIPFLYEAWKQDQPTLLITLYDVWVYGGNAEMEHLPVASWVPIDHVPVPPAVADFARKHHMLAMSRFGQEELARAGVQSTYIPHAIETSVFRPRESDFRRVANIPDDAFVVAINAANRDKIDRKGWAEMLAAFWLVAQKHDDMILYLHTTADDPAGISIRVLLASLGVPEKRVRIVPQVPLRLGLLGADALASMYSSCDVLLSVSRGEGFGIPVIEAQACGLPVIVSDQTAQPELCGAGWIAKTQAGWDFTQGAWFAQPLISQNVLAIERAYSARGDQELRASAVAFAAQYDADRVFDQHWRPALIDLEQKIQPPVTRQQKRAARRKR